VEHRLRVVEHGCRRVHRERSIRLDPRVVPALLLLEVHDEHVIGEDGPERQLAVLRLLLLHRRPRDPDRLTHDISPLEKFRYTGRIPGRSKRSRCKATTECPTAAYAAYAAGRAEVANEADGPFSSSRLEDDGFAIEPERLPIHVGDLTKARVVLHRVDQHRHPVALA